MQIRKLDITDLENLQKISITTFRETFEEVNSEEDMQKYLDENLSLERLKNELTPMRDLEELIKDTFQLTQFS